MPYRDGVGAARAVYEPQLDELRARAGTLDELGRDVPARLRVQIDTLLEQSSRPVRSMTEVERAHAQVRELALVDLATMTAASRRARWRARLRFAAVAGGMLALVGGTFVASSNGALESACRRSWACDDQGLCHADQVDSWACVAKSDADCAGACAARGTCTAKDGACVATTDASCAKSNQCTTDGACHAVGGACVVATDADCAASEVCRDAARCSADVATGTCELEHDRDCAASTSCTRDGLCAAWAGKCVSPAEKACRLAPACEESGLCSAAGTRCVASDDGDCQFSKACLDQGRCIAQGSACVRAPR